MTYQAFAVGLLSSEDILQFTLSFIAFTRDRFDQVEGIGLEISLVSVLREAMKVFTAMK